MALDVSLSGHSGITIAPSLSRFFCCCMSVHPFPWNRVVATRINGHLYERLELYAAAYGQSIATTVAEAVERLLEASENAPALQERSRD